MSDRPAGLWGKVAAQTREPTFRSLSVGKWPVEGETKDEHARDKNKAWKSPTSEARWPASGAGMTLHRSTFPWRP